MFTPMDLTGERYGRLIAKERCLVTNSKGKEVYKWKCICDCGNECYVNTGELRSGDTKSCGCYRKETTVRKNEENRQTNKYDLTTYDYAVGYTSNGYEFLFDKDDFDIVKDYCWYANVDKRNDYIRIQAHLHNQNNKSITLANLIMKPPTGYVVDHLNNNTLDNRKSNFSICTQTENMQNCKRRKDNTSGVTGVTWDSKHNKWCVYFFRDKI